MKTLELNQMENVQGGTLTQREVAANIGCAIAGFSMGLITMGLGFAFGLGCSLIAAAAD